MTGGARKPPTDGVPNPPTHQPPAAWHPSGTLGSAGVKPAVVAAATLSASARSVAAAVAFATNKPLISMPVREPCNPGGALTPWLPL